MIRKLAQKLFGVQSQSESYMKRGKALGPMFIEIFQEMMKALEEKQNDK